MKYFQTEKVTEQVTRIIGVSGEQMYLVIGKEKAALLDTGAGVGDLKGLVESLTDLPVMVLLTHGHVDHAMGVAPFSEVYMNHADLPVVKKHKIREYRISYLSGLLQNMEELEANMAEAPEEADFLNVKEGDRFDLGGMHLSIYQCPGHTPGSICILIEEERLLLTGDACNPFTFLFLEFCTGIQTYQKNLMALREHTAGLYDVVLTSHGDRSGTPVLLDEVIELCDEIMEGTAEAIPMEVMGVTGYLAKPINKYYARLDGKLGNIVYNKETIYQ